MKVFFLSILSIAIMLFTLQSKAQLVLKESSVEKLKIEVSAPNFKFVPKQTDKGFFNEFIVEGMNFSYDFGLPMLPTYNKMIRIPEGAKVNIDIVNSKYIDYNLADLSGNNYKLLPAQQSVPKNQIGELPLNYKREIYETNKFLGKELASCEIKGNMRNARLALLSVRPFDYNPVAGILRVYSDISLIITFPNANYVLTSEMDTKYSSYEFSGLQSYAINDVAFNSVRTNVAKYPTKMVIVSNIMFKDELKPFIDWKKKKGFTVVEAYTSDPAVGSTANSIKNYLKNLYDNATPSEPAHTYVLLVGDVDQLQTFDITAEGKSHPSDFYYVEYNGDILQDAYIGRFSANNISELKPQIDKTIEYEKYLFPNKGWLDTVITISGVDENFSEKFGNGQVRYTTSTYLNELNGIHANIHLYPGSAQQGAQIKNEASRGASLINYTAHGEPIGFVNPIFSIVDVYNLQNAHKYPLVIGNACLTNKYDYNGPDYPNTCFGESWLRAQDKGGIGYIGGSNLTYWEEDYSWIVGARIAYSENETYNPNSLGAFDRLMHTHGEAFQEWFYSQGQMVVAGNLAVMQSGSPLSKYYCEIYTLMGDPSLMPYIGEPMEMEVVYSPILLTNEGTIHINTEPYAYVAISKDGVLLGAGIANAVGDLIININPIGSDAILDVVATKQFCQPFFSTIEVANPSTSFLSSNGVTISDTEGNNNNQADVSEKINLNITFKNYGQQNATNSTVTIATSDPNVQIVGSNSVNIGTINAGETITKESIFSIKIDTLVQDKHRAVFNLVLNDDTGIERHSNFKINIFTPIFSVGNAIIDDTESGNHNGRIDIGESVSVLVPIENIGHADATSVICNLVSTNSNISFFNSTFDLASLNIESNDTAKFKISVSNIATSVEVADLKFKLSTLKHISGEKDFIFKIGQAVEDFESNNLSKFDWQTSGNMPWVLIDSNAYSGKYCIRSGVISNNQSSTLSLKINVLKADTLAFYKKVSCEYAPSGFWDFFRFKMNGTIIKNWDGEIDWTMEKHPIGLGEQLLEWIYYKDESGAVGSDAAYIDDVFFPPMTVKSAIENIHSNDKEISIYPNPATDRITISVPVLSGDVQLIIYSTNGQIVYSENFTTPVGQMYIPINISGFEQGLYYATISQADNNLHSKTFVVIK